MDLNRGTGTQKISENKFIRPLEIVIDGFWKGDPTVRNELPVEVDIPE